MRRVKIDRIVAAALAGAAAIVIGGGTALAGLAGEGARNANCEERLARAAEKRGLSVSELTAQIRVKAFARIDAARVAGRITQEKADKLKENFAAGRLCHRPRAATALHATRNMFRAAADFLGLTKAELRAELRGTSLGALAQEQGKSVESLEAAMLDQAKTKLAKAVEAGRITQARADRVLERLERRVDRLVARIFPAG